MREFEKMEEDDVVVYPIAEFDEPMIRLFGSRAEVVTVKNKIHSGTIESIDPVSGRYLRV